MAFFSKKPLKKSVSSSKVFRPQSLKNPEPTKVFKQMGGIARTPKPIKKPGISLRQTRESVPLIPLYLHSIRLGFAALPIVRYSYRFALSLIGLALIIFIVYLSVFDSTFYLKKYTIETTPDSFIGDTGAQTLVNDIKSRNLLGFLPLNNYWFLNQNAINESIAQNPLFSKVTLTSKEWTDKTTLLVQTDPALATLALTISGEKQYVVLAQNGTLLGTDSTHIRKNVIDVISPLIVTQGTLKETLQLEKHPVQLQKIWFAQLLKQWLADLSIPIAAVAFSSLSDYDPDIVVTTTRGAVLLFDYQAFDKTLQRERLRTTWTQTSLAKDEKNALVSYVDFRIEKRVFWCLKTEMCSIDKNQ